jgi:hypothetical protein
MGIQKNLVFPCPDMPCLNRGLQKGAKNGSWTSTRHLQGSLSLPLVSWNLFRFVKTWLAFLFLKKLFPISWTDSSSFLFEKLWWLWTPTMTVFCTHVIFHNELSYFFLLCFIFKVMFSSNYKSKPWLFKIISKVQKS